MNIKAILILMFLSLAQTCCANTVGVTLPKTVSNPILPGFNPDPSICRVGDDYYLVTSSFAFYPGLPIYHSRDLVNWKLVGHAIDSNNIDKFHFEGIGDNDGIWAPTIRYHEGTFYISCTAWRSGGNFIITAKDPAGEWSAPVWVPDAPGIDPTLFWDNGKAYYIGNRYDFKKQWPGQVGIYIQEIDLSTTVQRTIKDTKTGLAFDGPAYQLKGENKILSYGHANNATYAEGPHIYKIGGTYYLLMAEGGSGKFHAVTVQHSKSLFGPYTPQPINPVLSHRQMGNRYGLQNIGHADLIQIQNGEWYAICLGNRMMPVPEMKNHPYVCPLGRETFLTKAEFQDGQLVLAPNAGIVEMKITRPDLPWTPVTDTLTQWYTPMTMPNLRLKKIKSHSWTYERQITNKSKERGITLFRTINSRYTLLKTKKSIVLEMVDKGIKSVIAEIPYKEKNVTLGIAVDGMTVRFICNGKEISTQSFLPLCDDQKFNKFNGTGVGDVLEMNNNKYK